MGHVLNGLLSMPVVGGPRNSVPITLTPRDPGPLGSLGTLFIYPRLPIDALGTRVPGLRVRQSFESGEVLD